MYIFIYNNDFAAARLLGCSYGQLRQMHILQKTGQPTTFCVKSKKKYKCNLNVYKISCPSITSSTTSCLSVTSQLLHLISLPQVYSELIYSRGPCLHPPPPPPPPPPPLQQVYSTECLLYLLQDQR